MSPVKPYLPGGEIRIGHPGLHLTKVGAGAEGSPSAGQQHHRDPRILGRGQQGLGGGVVEGLVEGVERLGPVQGKGAYPVLVVDVQYHGRTPYRNGVLST
ncbi:hypothetical protein MHEC_22690 [Mycobacterium heckeshornense]|uniref:Uncharacterized protein n=1 Tax=Mycobacterium heckeshornense TaxID=110505 RepID=A0A7R7GTV3_9MYCO|nr:hypothetical protein MHEC_22690 [Mycobacterium heckeshornense]